MPFWFWVKNYLAGILNYMNFKTLVLCFIAASVYWLLNALNKSGYTTRINYPIDIRYNDSLYIPVSPLPKTIKVSVSSTGWNLLKDNFFFNVSPLEYEIVNPELQNHLDTAVLTEKLTQKLRNTKVNFVSTDTLVFNFEKKIRKTIVLKVDSIAVDLEKNFVIASLINVTPAEIVIEGPASAVNDLKDTFYLKVPARNLAINYDDKIRVPLPRNPMLKASAEKAAVSFEVAELLK
ncbi:hypothetical protein C0V77_06165 [Emticicia sp. TH156]|nr:hypothetical protein C0V77_06165 [Emticicia sp. TH156]